MNTVRLTIAILFLFLSIFSLSVFLEKNAFLQNPPIHYVPPLEFVKLISGTFQSFWADVFYIRGIMAITGDFENKTERTFWVQENLKLAVALDSNLLQAYFFAGLVMGQDEETIKMCIKFLKNAFSKKPLDWHIPCWIGFNFYELGDYLSAIEYYKKAAQLPNGPKYLKSNQPMLYYKAGKIDLGIVYTEGLLHSIKDSKQLEGIEIKLNWLKNIVTLEQKVEEFKEMYGETPENLEQLAAKGFLDKIPEDPFLGGYFLDKKTDRVKSLPLILPR